MIGIVLSAEDTDTNSTDLVPTLRVHSLGGKIDNEQTWYNRKYNRYSVK